MTTSGRLSFDPCRSGGRGAKPASAATFWGLTTSGRISSLDGEHTFDRELNPGGGDADGTTAGDLGLPRRLRRHTWLPPHCAGDWRGGWPGLALHRPRTPGGTGAVRDG